MSQSFRSRNMNPMIGRAAIAASLVLAAAVSAHAAEPKFLGQHKDWNAFVYEEGGHKVCYVSSQPKKAEAGGKARGDVHVLITHRPHEKALDVVSIMAGYTYKAGTEAQVTIGKDSFKLFTDGDTAWARDDKSDKALVAAMKAGASMVVKGTSSKGTNTTDTYSLAGIGLAYAAIGEACGVKTK
ncbi:MAG TPA: invasion associated locus B family protein [Azospirillaceae bacterium]|nr:invasion associated locus B family protein [Azospirillaceae bacterium]